MGHRNLKLKERQEEHSQVWWHKACNSSTWGWRQGVSGVQGHPRLHSEFGLAWPTGDFVSKKEEIEEKRGKEGKTAVDHIHVNRN